jgi:hypothetical protein
MIEVVKASTQRSEQTRLPGAIRTVQHDDAGRQGLEIELGDAAPVFHVNAAEDHAFTSRAT